MPLLIKTPSGEQIHIGSNNIRYEDCEVVVSLNEGPGWHEGVLTAEQALRAAAKLAHSAFVSNYMNEAKASGGRMPLRLAPGAVGTVQAKAMANALLPYLEEVTEVREA